jgi:hypothetical protein
MAPVTEGTPRALADLVALPRLRSFFAPRSIALIGASGASNWSRNLYASLTQGGGPPGPLTVIHPHRESVLGLPTYRRLPGFLAAEPRAKS